LTEVKPNDGDLSVAGYVYQKLKKLEPQRVMQTLNATFAER
jgi:hypothetical protein